MLYAKKPVSWTLTGFEKNELRKWSFSEANIRRQFSPPNFSPASYCMFVTSQSHWDKTSMSLKHRNMRTQLQLFKFENGDHFDNVRTVEINGEFWFVASDVAKVLGYKKPNNAIATHCREKGTLKQGIPTTSGVQQMVLINEPNVYRLISKSQLPEAERFEIWLFEEVVPSIRKTGGYGIDRRKTSNFIERYFRNFNKVTPGHFSVITELYVRLYGRLEHAGYVIPDKGVNNKDICPDISVGQRFSRYLKDKYPSAPEEFETYKHTYESGKVVDARLYPIDLISIFIRYVDEHWIPDHAETYLGERDPKALDYLPKLLGN